MGQRNNQWRKSIDPGVYSQYIFQPRGLLGNILKLNIESFSPKNTINLYLYLYKLSMSIFSKIFPKKSTKKVLVLSGGGFRWFYSIWILKWLEELWIDKDIDAIFGVSIGAIVWSAWASGMSADEIYNQISKLSIGKFYAKDVFKKTWWLLSHKKIEELIHSNIPKRFSSLKKKMYIWAVDAHQAEYILFQKWNLPEIVLGSMSIPGVFPPVEYKDHLLVDWGVLNNFPVDIAREMYPHHKIIWVALNKFQKNQEINTVFDNIMIAFEMMLRSKLLENTKFVDYLFYKKIPISILSLDKKKMKKAYEMWYQDCIKKFS